MSLRKKILFGYGIALILVLVVLVWAVVDLVSLGEATGAILHENYKSILAAENMIDAIDRQDSAALLAMLDYPDEGLRQFRENESRFLLWLGRAKDNITVPGEADVVSAIETGYSAYLVNSSKLRDARGTDPKAAGSFYHETVLPSLEHVRQGCTRLRELNQDAMFTASRRAERVARAAILSTIVVGVAAIGVGLAFSLILSTRLVRPIKQVRNATEALAAGNYDVQVPAVESDELGELAKDFNDMAARLGTFHRLNVEQIIAEKRKSDAVLRCIEDGVIVVDAQFRISHLNPPAARILGLDPGQAAHKHFLEVIKDQELFSHVRTAADSGQTPAIAEGGNILTIRDGDSARHYMFAVTPVVSNGGGMLGVVLLLRDVTRLKELDRLKSEFVMTASHELKTPLQTIGMSIDLLTEGATDKLTVKQRQLLAAAHEEVQRLKSLIADLLDLSKIEAGKVEMDIDRVPVRELVDRAIGALQTQADELKVELTARPPEEVPDVRADANKITWVLTNLISNALRYVHAGGHIRVSAEQVGDRVHVSVADDGEGIPQEYQSRVFDKFVHVRGQKSPGGTGLGLAICKEIIRAHKGTIWVDSAGGKGTTFTFTLPLASQEQENTHGSETSPHC